MSLKPSKRRHPDRHVVIHTVVRRGRHPVRNRNGGSDRHGPVNCESARAELSAALDGEQSRLLTAGFEDT
jgi:hypothetical protein